MTGRGRRAGGTSLLRSLLWRLVLTLTGGLRVAGQLPAGACVIVANHCSHADTVALLAALPARRRPVVAAAADYWFARSGRTVFCRLLVAGFPIHRGGGGTGELMGAHALLAEGRDVIVFPEGTRSRDGSIGRFRSGAFLLAQRSGVPLVPIGIAGTSELMPVHGRPAHARVSVRIGSPTADLAVAEAAVRQLARPTRSHRRAPGPMDRPRTDSWLRLRLATFAGSAVGLAFMAAWAAAEATIWPLLPEFALAILAVAAPRRAVHLTLAAVAGSLAGGAVAYALAAHGAAPPAPLTTARMNATAAAQLAAFGPVALRQQPMSGIPYKVYARAAGESRLGLPAFLAASIPARGLRIAVAGLLSGVLGGLGRRWRRWYPTYLGLFLALFAAGLAAVVTSWS
jgi:1-acyl-sn-glycerol-3-phosphate acyltransferase